MARFLVSEFLPDKVSILEDIDFEIDLLRRDRINVDYILSLLKNLDIDSPTFDKDKELVLKTVKNSIELRSKKELIDQFINSCFIPGGDVDGDFEDFMIKEKNKELGDISVQEKLHIDKMVELLDEYDFTGRLDEDILESAFTENLGLIDRRRKKEGLLAKIRHFIEKFSL